MTITGTSSARQTRNVWVELFELGVSTGIWIKPRSRDYLSQDGRRNCIETEIRVERVVAHAPPVGNLSVKDMIRHIESAVARFED